MTSSASWVATARDAITAATRVRAPLYTGALTRAALFINSVWLTETDGWKPSGVAPSALDGVPNSLALPTVGTCIFHQGGEAPAHSYAFPDLFRSLLMTQGVRDAALAVCHSSPIPTLTWQGDIIGAIQGLEVVLWSMLPPVSDGASSMISMLSCGFVFLCIVGAQVYCSSGAHVAACPTADRCPGESDFALQLLAKAESWAKDKVPS